MFTKGRLKITITNVRRIPKPGKYGDLEELSKFNLVELSLLLPATEDYSAAAKTVSDFAEQLKP